ncbi:heat shock factor protein-like [Centruroides vittatus]|uniref:heat shock factor protein-like n=1 Tax=Centruroides vittatus TaxID=120091 RepID=UPI00350EACFC
MMQTPNLVRNNVGLPVFIAKLWKIVEDPETDDLISWGSDGTSFVIKNQTRFSKELLPLYFKHGNMTSFVRQLNMYGFRKMTNIAQSGLHHENEEIEFYHQYFIKGQELLLSEIKRKIPVTKSSPNKKKTEILKDIISDVETIHANQETLDTTIHEMKRENEALWREVAILRQKDQKQQKVVERLVQFLASIIQTNRNVGLKRKIPLMIEGDGEKILVGEKIPRLSRQLSKDKRLNADLCNSSSFSISANSPTGPVIHEITDLVNDPIFTDNDSEINLSSEVQKDLASPIKATVDEASPNSFADYQVETELPNVLDEHLFELNDPIEVISSSDPLDNLNTLVESSKDHSLKMNKTDESPKSKKSNKIKDQESKHDQMQIAISSNSNNLSNSLQNSFADILENISPDLDWIHELMPNSSLLELSADENLAHLTEFLQEENDDDIIKGNEIMKYSPVNIDSSTPFHEDLFNDVNIENELDID